MGTDPVRSALTTKYVRKLLKIKASQLKCRPEFRQTDLADIEHDLIAHVLKNAGNYDPARSAPNTFITRVVQTAAAMLIRDRGRAKRAAGYWVISLDRTDLHGNDERPIELRAVVSEDDLRRRCGGRVNDSLKEVELSADVAQAMEGLTARQRDIATRLVNAPEVDVARQLGVSRRQIHNVVLAIREHFENAGLKKS